MSYNLSNNWIMTYSGIKFDLVNPQKDQVNLADMAHSLTQNCRYTGHCKFFYSVAMHCLNGAYKLYVDGYSVRLQLLFLLHDASETWYNDIAKPLKPLLTDYAEFERKCMEVVWAAFEIDPPTEEEQEIIDKYDVMMLQNEIRILMPNPEEFGVEVLDNIEIAPMRSFEEIKDLFIEAVNTLRRGL